jgi:hypothetical protein
MKTFMMIYHQDTKVLISEYEEINDPIATFNSWYLESDVTYDLLKKLVVFYFIGSTRNQERKSGMIKFDAVLDRLEFNESPLYFNYSEEGLNFIYYLHKKILWDDKHNIYLLVPENSDDFDEDELYDFSFPLNPLMPPMDTFLEVKIKYHFFISERGRNILRVDPKPLKYKSFYKKCKTCKNVKEVTIENMINGRVNCNICELSKQTITKKQI